MNDITQLKNESKRALQRLIPRVKKELESSVAADPNGWQDFSNRLDKYFPALFSLYLGMYGGQYDFFFHLALRPAAAKESAVPAACFA